MKFGLSSAHPFSQYLRESNVLFVVSTMLLALMCALAGAFLSPSEPGRVLSYVFSGQLLLLLLAFVNGLGERPLVYFGCLLGMLYLFAVSLTEGHLYSSTLAWMPLVPLAIFYVVNPRAGRLWMLIAALMLVLMAVIAWFWGHKLPLLNGPELPFMSFADWFLATVALFCAPYFYQRQLEQHLYDKQARQRALQAKQVELEHTLQMREHFIATVSHELRTPMNAIMGLNTVLLDRVKDKPQARKVLQYTRQSADHLMTVINDVLDYSQFSSGHISPRLERFALHDTVRAAFELFLPKIESTRLNYVCEIQDDVPKWVSTDRHRLMQILVNLLGNAIKFTHQGEVCLRVHTTRDGVMFSVQDTGVGIADHHKSRIFQRFVQAEDDTQSRYGGTGLGLSITQRLVTLMSGQMDFDSTLGQGSVFRFSLPLLAHEAPQVSQEDPVQPTSDERNLALKFLVVDDHPINRLLVKQVLSNAWPNSRVVEAEDGLECLKAMQQEPFDMVLMDMVMPNMDGIEATKSLRTHLDSPACHTPVLGLTANVNPLDLERFKAAGLTGLMLKPFEPAQLRAKVEAWITDNKVLGFRTFSGR
jgi:signal transduction histidine kinase/CheY-like chemotaxis protein